MKTPTGIFAYLLLAALFSGCVPTTTTYQPPQETSRKQLAALSAQWEKEDARINEAFGERIYDKDPDVVFSAVVTGLANAGLAIKNMERQSGYILAEGPSPIPPDQFIKLEQPAVDEINKVSSRKNYHANASGPRSVTITVIKFGVQKTKVKMRINRLLIISSGSNSSIYPAVLQADYQCCWRALEGQIFLDENLDKVKP